MPKLTATTTVTTEVKISPLLKRKLLQEFRAYQVLKAEMAPLEAQLEAIKAKVQHLREQTGEKGLTLEGYKTKLVEPTRKTLDHKKLIELGCAAAWIEEATTEKPTKPYERITLPGEKEREY